ncbi:MAG: hypothetical protein IPF83_01140 [Rhodanobacteraceae bacterium]|nr:hypothetical protein [Rhodanobacteraceae bacterium]
MFAVLLLVLVFVSTASASLLPHREIPACERAAPQLDEFAIAACLGDTEPCFGRCASTEMLMRPRMARGVVDADLHGKSEPPNGRDRLIQAQPNAPNEAIVEYQYDADDRRIARIETPRINGVPQAPITTLYVFDNSTLLHEANLAGITDTYRRSAKLDRHIAHQTNTVRHYQLDALDTPVAMTDATGATVNATTFDAWGNPTQQTAAGTTTVPWQVPNYNPLISGQAALLNNDNQSIGFTGYQKDSATGLYYAGARFYDPMIGGFNGMDPAFGDTKSPITLNKYLYANANPLVFIDPDGRYGLAMDSLRRDMSQTDAMRLHQMRRTAAGITTTAAVVTVGSAAAVESAVALGVTKASLVDGGGALYSTGRQYATTGDVNGVEVIFDSGMTLVGGRVLLGGLGSGSQFVRGASKVAAAGLALNSVAQGVENFSEGIAEGNFARASLGVSEIAGGVAGFGSLLPRPTVAPDTSVAARTVVVEEAPASNALPGKTVYVDSRGNAVIADAELPTNYRGQRVVVPEGHQLSARDPGLAEAPLFERGPFTQANREGFLAGNAGGTQYAPHHRHQLPTTAGGVIDETAWPGHPLGNEHTSGTPSRHPNPSIFRRTEGGELLRGREIRDNWTQKGERLIEIEPGVWVDPGPEG